MIRIKVSPWSWGTNCPASSRHWADEVI